MSKQFILNRWHKLSIVMVMTVAIALSGYQAFAALTFDATSVIGSTTLSLSGAAGSAITVGDAAQTGTISVGTSTGAMTLNLGTGNSAKTIAIGTGTAIDTINIGTGATGVDVITVGSSTATLVLRGQSAAENEVGIAATRLTGATSSFQPVWGDLTYQGAAGGTGSYNAGVMGNFMGTALTNSNATIHAGTIGKYSVVTSDALVGPKAGLVGEAETSVANSAVMAVLGGDTGTVAPGAAYAVRYLNSTAASKFTYGLDLYSAAVGGYKAVDYGTADIRLQNSATIVNGSANVLTITEPTIALVASTAVTTSAALTVGNALSVTTGGIDVNSSGITEAGAISGASSGAFSGVVTLSGNDLTILAVTGVPADETTSSLVQLGPAIAGGSAIGTYLGSNPATFTGDFVNLQVAGVSKFKVTNAGAVTTAGGAAITGDSTVTGGTLWQSETLVVGDGVSPSYKGIYANITVPAAVIGGTQYIKALQGMVTSAASSAPAETWGVYGINNVEGGAIAAYGAVGEINATGAGTIGTGAVNTFLSAGYFHSDVRTAKTISGIQDVPLVGIIESTTGRRKADAAVGAVLAGAISQSTAGAGAAFKAYDFNTEANFDYGLDLYYLSGSYSNVFGTADIRLQNGETISNGTDGFISLGGKAIVAGAALGSHLRSTQTTAPTGTTGSCTVDSVDAGATDMKGTITATCNNQTAIVAFNVAYATAPACVVTPMNSLAAVNAHTTTYVVATTGITITQSGNIGEEIWAYICIE